MSNSTIISDNLATIATTRNPTRLVTYSKSNITGGAVTSVNTQTGAVTLDADDLSDTSTTNKFATAAQLTNIDNQSGINTGDQDISGIATNTTAISLNTAKTTNANHTGDATGSTSLTLATVNSNVGSFTTADITVDAKGRITAAASGSGGAVEFLDSTFRINNSANETKQLGFDCSGITASTTRTITAPDFDWDINDSVTSLGNIISSQSTTQGHYYFGTNLTCYLYSNSAYIRSIFNTTTVTQINSNGEFRLIDAGHVQWSSSGQAWDTVDTGLLRDSAGVVKVTDGSTGSGGLTTGTLNISNIPTASAGLSSGDVWSDSGTLKIVT